ncbi:hypothetical protein ABW20_dc0102436 [Dactylellina cionopaga]|nr:hypothetical protein ABW20_dc0102436 [Dactylellina cionopaga]
MVKDDKKNPEEVPEEQGASPKEILFEACRVNNVELLNEILESDACTAEFLNESRNALGEMALHVAVKYGNYEILDTLLDTDGLEVDPENFMDKETPLHVAAKYTGTDADIGAHMVDLLVDAGADPRLKNSGQQKPVDLVDPSCEEVRDSLKKAEVTYTIQAEIQRETALHHAQAGHDIDDDEAGSGPASDSE